jgi:hypothetical protein
MINVLIKYLNLLHRQGEKKNSHNFLIGKLEGKRHVEDLSINWKDNIKTDVKLGGCGLDSCDSKQRPVTAMNHVFDKGGGESFILQKNPFPQSSTGLHVVSALVSMVASRPWIRSCILQGALNLIVLKPLLIFYRNVKSPGDAC